MTTKTTMSTSSTIRRPSITDQGVAGFFEGIVAKDFLQIVCGEFLGGGVGRGVYECLLNEDLIIKVETAGHSFQNAMEWMVWDAVKKDDKLSPFFAPCFSISSCGCILIMSRTLKPEPEEWETRMPAFFTDFKRDNFGMYEDRLVCHDYGFHKMLTSGTTARLINADWRD